MKTGDKVQVKDVENVVASFRGRVGIVTADSEAGDVVAVEFADKGDTHAFNADELGQVARRTAGSKTRAFKAHASR
ncbi:MAG TPA: hypothetical protein VN911_14035 [Candidatus Acidoferrum sp.]|jgi:hypothetical protein|nr:hypothetical protein [Candidatus Acidoferrum sp.]